MELMKEITKLMITKVVFITCNLTTNNYSMRGSGAAVLQCFREPALALCLVEDQDRRDNVTKNKQRNNKYKRSTTVVRGRFLSWIISFLFPITTYTHLYNINCIFLIFNIVLSHVSTLNKPCNWLLCTTLVKPKTTSPVGKNSPLNWRRNGKYSDLPEIQAAIFVQKHVYS